MENVGFRLLSLQGSVLKSAPYRIELLGYRLNVKIVFQMSASTTAALADVRPISAWVEIGGSSPRRGPLQKMA